MERVFHRHLLMKKMFISALRMLSASREKGSGTFHCVIVKVKIPAMLEKHLFLVAELL